MATGSEGKSDSFSILVIDDDEVTREIIKTASGKVGHVVYEAASATEGRQKLEDMGFNVDAVLLDLGLPDANGEDFLEWIKVMSPKVAVVIISAEKSDQALIRCLNKGATDFIEKPFNVKKVLDTVRLGIKHQKTTDENLGDMQADLYTTDWIELTAQSEMEYLGRIQRFSEILFNRRLPKKVVDDLRLAMEEFGRNAVEWGNRFDKDKQFRISYCFFPDRVVLKFEDEGEGFDPYKVPDPSKDPIAHLKGRQEAGKRPGGFGLFMMNKIMDDIFYNEKGNTCVMTKYLNPGPEDASEQTE